MDLFKLFRRRRRSQGSFEGQAYGASAGSSPERITSTQQEVPVGETIAQALSDLYRAEYDITQSSEERYAEQQALHNYATASDAMYRKYLAQITAPDARVEDIADEAATALTELKRLSIGDESALHADFWQEEATKLRDELTVSWGRINQLARISVQIQGWNPDDRETAAALLSIIHDSSDQVERADAERTLQEMVESRSPLSLPKPSPLMTANTSEAARIQTQFSRAIREGDLQEASTLLSHFPNLAQLQMRSPLDGRPLGLPLFRVAMSASDNGVDMARLLIAHGAVAAESDPERGTPLHAAAYDNAGLAEVLLEFGAEVDACGPLDSTPLCLAASTGSITAARVLLQRGAEVNVMNGRPLRWAARNGEIGTVELLLAYDAQFDLRDLDEGTALEQAEAHGHTAIANLMRAKS